MEGAREPLPLKQYEGNGTPLAITSDPGPPRPSSALLPRGLRPTRTFITRTSLFPLPAWRGDGKRVHVVRARGRWLSVLEP
eukprot:3244017-Pyramimonas_sp.AAC.1